jgi:hypothetical protein
MFKLGVQKQIIETKPYRQLYTPDFKRSFFFYVPVVSTPSKQCYIKHSHWSTTITQSLPSIGWQQIVNTDFIAGSKTSHSGC